MIEEIALSHKRTRGECSHRRAQAANERFWRADRERIFQNPMPEGYRIIPSGDPRHGYQWEYGKGEITPATFPRREHWRREEQRIQKWRKQARLMAARNSGRK